MATVSELQKEYLPSLAPEDFFVLLAHATGKEKVFLLAHPEYALTQTEASLALQCFKRRLKHEPVAYITGHKEFYGRDFLVTQDTLIPRPETELLIEAVLNAIFNFQFSIFKNIDIVDIGTGSGNIIVTIAKEVEKIYPVPSIQYYALDISPEALAVTKKNAEHHDVAQNILFIESDLLKNVTIPPVSDRHLIITANLPYLSTEIYRGSNADVREYEPRTALESGPDGLDHYRRLLIELLRLSRLPSFTTLFVEISPEQTPVLTKEILHIFPQAMLLTLQDLSGRDRLIQATF